MMSDADRRLAAFTARNDGCFRVTDAVDAGLDWEARDARLRAGVWTEVHPGVLRLTGAPNTWWGRLRCACWAGGAHAAVSGRAAAKFYGLPGGAEIVEITSPRWLRTRASDVVVHETTRADPRYIRVIDGVPFFTPERVILDLAARLPHHDFVETVLHAARRKQLVTLPSMRAMVDDLGGRGRRGIAMTRAVLDEWQPASRPTESEMETLLLQAIRAHGLPEPEPQFVVRDGAGNFIARTDFGYAAARVTIEYDSISEHSDEISLARDEARRNRIAGQRYVHLVARYDDLRSGGHAICAEIRNALRAVA